MLTLIEGPAGSGKSTLARDMKTAGEVDIVADVTQLWAATGQYERDPLTGKFPVRSPDDPALRAAVYLQATAVSFGLREGMRVAVTTSQRNQAERWGALAAQNNSPFSIRTVDLDESIVRARLADPETGILDPSCEDAIGRWFV